MFSSRFPELATLLALSTVHEANIHLQALTEDIRIEQAKNGEATLAIVTRFVHSRYNPTNEALRIVSDSNMRKSEGLIMYGIGLGYVAEQYALLYPNSTIIILEPEIPLLALCLASRDLVKLFNHPSLVFVAGADQDITLQIIEQYNGARFSVYESQATTKASELWFSLLKEKILRSNEKKNINSNTLKKFRDLWLRNMCRNLSRTKDCNSIELFKNSFCNTPALLLAAGPSLDTILPHLAQIQKKCVLIAVDTALRACLRVGVEPDFIIIADPQYWNWKHLEGLKTLNSIVITEIATWPKVFNITCKAFFLFASRFPLAQFMEQKLGITTELGAGGSVSTTAWDFARFLGVSTIFVAGLDLAFPEKKTHVKGSFFEESVHQESTRFDTAETRSFLSLYTAGPFVASNYLGEPVLTDKRMSLYSWWFEAQLANYPQNKTLTLTKQGLKIPGIEASNLEALLQKEDIRDSIDNTIHTIVFDLNHPQKNQNMLYQEALQDLIFALEDIGKLANSAIKICSEGQKDRPNKLIANKIRELNAIDSFLLHHSAKDLIAMIFDQHKENTSTSEKSTEDPFAQSINLYRKIWKAADRNLRLLKKYAK